MKELALRPELKEVLLELGKTPFTVGELTKRYQRHSSCAHHAKKPARQFVYRTMQRLIEVGLLAKTEPDGGWPKYQLDRRFFNQAVLAKTFQTRAAISKESPPDPLPTNLEKNTVLTDNARKVLTERLKQHRNDMLCALGEAEEYDALCHDFPELKDNAQPLYADARERSTMILGKIKALEGLLSPDRLANSSVS